MEAIATDHDLSRASFAAFEELPENGTWLDETRRSALESFGELGLPTPRLEEWKYTSVAAIAATPFRPALAEEQSPAVAAEPSAAAAQLVFVNGHWSRELSSTRPFPPGVRVMSLREVLEKEPARLEAHLTRHADFRRSAFTALNTAFLQDGAFVEFLPGAVIAEPIQLTFLSEAARDPTVSHPRVLVVAGAASQGSVVETYLGDSNRYFTNAVTEIACGAGSVLDHYKLQREGASGLHVHALHAVVERSSQFVSHNLAFGAALARTDLSVVFAGEGGDCMLNGLFVGSGAQHLDNHTTIDHARPHCVSRELYKGILDGRSRGVFHGKIIVRPDAQKTDAMQTNKNLLLSREALVNSTPALEILADDVKCRHGSTIGQLDAAALFYLRSRGIAEPEARHLLTYAFAADVAERIRIPAIRRAVESHLGLRLARVREEAA